MEAAARQELEQCKVEVKTGQTYREEIPGVVQELVESCLSQDCFDHVNPEPIPSRDAVIAIIHRAFRLLYPGYFSRRRVDAVNLGFHLGEEAVALFEELSRQITLSFRHECLRYGLPCIHCQEQGQAEAVRFLRELPRLRAVLATDVQAAYQGDPAANSHDEVIFSYPGLFAVTVYRAAHQLLRQGVPLMPRIMTEYAHSLTGIDIHPGAQIGESFFIDHGTGVVIGETTEIGHRVRIYQGVTLGALSLPPDQVDPPEPEAPPHRGRRRHHLFRGHHSRRRHGDRRPGRHRRQRLAHRLGAPGHQGVSEKARIDLPGQPCPRSPGQNPG